VEPRAAAKETAPQANAPAAPMRPAPKAPPSTPGSEDASKFLAPARPTADNGTQRSAEARPPADKANVASNDKPALKVDDPFADIDSLEAEMARLLGREKPE
jgi:hypothetical protein